ncbi:flagellar assembly protein FliH [Bacillus sp. Marseille-P3661]|uniref:flagellar assembly protein FliH n=1 Tax=Bacillus sp. Marseille-P3661 TaxID=1936234 RepID=UPI000C821B2C|nr:flagellar assembly protein FliH [Bacillus sp. Marseille-P3661]
MSRVIKANFTQGDAENKRIITLKPLAFQQNDMLEHNNEFDDHLEKPKMDIKEVEMEAARIVAEAEQKASTIIQQAQEKYNEMLHQIELERQSWDVEKEHWIEQAKQEGFAQGFEIGKQDGYSEYKGAIAEAQQTVLVAKDDYQKNIELSEMTILHLGLKTAEKIMGFTLDLNPDAFLNLVKRVIKEVKEHQNIQIHVHPAYYDLVVSQKAEIRALFTNPLTELYIYPDDELGQTSCIIESSFGRIDASIDNQLNEMKIKLLQLLEEDGDDESR